jgi:uncharacterized protein YihD (DUF1040 family)
MRDSKRIPRVLDLLEKVWQEVPDWRLGQLIENIARDMGWNDAYYMEDDDLEKELRKHIDLL